MSEEAGAPTTPRTDAGFQDLMAELGEAKAAYDLAVRAVSVEQQPDGAFGVDREQYERWREASRRLRAADDAMLAFLERSIE